MQTTQLRKRLIQQMNDEPHVRSWIVWSKCGAGLAVVALIAAMGSNQPLEREAVTQAQPVQHTAQSAEQHRRQIFEERRVRYEQRGDNERVVKQQAPSNGLRRLSVQ